MFTSIDKAIVAAIGALIFILQTFGVVLPEWATSENATAIIAALTPLAVYFFPNKA